MLSRGPKGIHWGGHAGTAAQKTGRLTSFRLASDDETPDVDCSELPHVRVEGVKRLWGNLISVNMQPSGVLLFIATRDTRWSSEREESYAKEGFPKGGGVATADLS